MLTMHPTLLIGPADWDPQRMPKAEFDGRISRLWQAFPDAAGAVVLHDPPRQPAGEQAHDDPPDDAHRATVAVFPLRSRKRVSVVAGEPTT